MTFKEWLHERRDEDSPIGDLAGDAFNDKKFPWTSDWRKMQGYLDWHPSACDQARNTLREALRQWQESEGKDPGPLLPHRR